MSKMHRIFCRRACRIRRSCSTERDGDRGDPPPQAPVVRDRLIANMSVSMLSVRPTVARDKPSPYGNKGRFGFRGTRVVSGVGMS